MIYISILNLALKGPENEGEPSENDQENSIEEVEENGFPEEEPLTVEEPNNLSWA